MTKFPRRLVPGIVRRSYPLKFGLVMVLISVIAAGGIYATGRFAYPAVAATLGGTLLTGFVGTVLSWRTAKAVETVAVTPDERTDEDTPRFDTARIDCVGRVASAMATTHETLHEEHEARLVAEEERSTLEETITEYQRSIHRCANGDLGERLEPRTDNDVLTEFATGCNDLLTDVEDLLRNVTQLVHNVDTPAEAEQAIGSETADDELSDSLRSLSNDVDAQILDLQTATNQVRQLVTVLEEVTASLDTLEQTSRQTVTLGETGRDAAMAAVDEMDTIETEAAETVEAIENLEEEVQQVDELIDFIAEIAEQTNMLALNAHIEASRAGKQGAGFAAVANEIKELAEHTKEAADDIEERLTRIQRQTDQSVEEVRETSNRIGTQTAAVETATDALDEIVNSAQETTVGVTELQETTQKQVTSMNDVLETVEAAIEIGESITDEVETVSATIESSTANDLRNTPEQFSRNDYAAQLRDQLTEFDIETDSPDTETESTEDEPTTSAEEQDAPTASDPTLKTPEPDGGRQTETIDGYEED